MGDERRWGNRIFLLISCPEKLGVITLTWGHLRFRESAKLLFDSGTIT